MQVADLSLAGWRGSDTTATPLEIPAPHFGEGVPADLSRSMAGNVARLYAHLARDLTEGSRTVPDLRHALERHRLIDAIERASATGTAQSPR